MRLIDCVFKSKFKVETNIPKLIWVIPKSRGESNGVVVLVACEKKIFNPTHITVSSNLLVPIPKWFSWTSFLFLVEGHGEEIYGFRLQQGD